MRYVVTGGPGAGKSTLIDSLAAAGHRVVPEAGRRIIRGQLAAGGTALPWRDPDAFGAAMVDDDIAAWHTAAGPDPVYFDRGVPDTIGYLRLTGRPVPRRLRRAAARLRYDRVFVAPYWPEIYRTDGERRQSPDEAAGTCVAVVDAYRRLGYTPVVLPLTDVGSRVRFVLANT